MLDLIKNMAMQKLAEKMGPNNLNADATNQAAAEGSNALMETIQSAISGGDMSQLTDLFSSGGASMENNGLFQNVQSKMMEILQSKGMNAAEATSEAQSTVPDIINSLKSKFESTDAADQDFDITKLAGSLLGGNAGDMLSKAKGLFS